RRVGHLGDVRARRLAPEGRPLANRHEWLHGSVRHAGHPRAGWPHAPATPGRQRVTPDAPRSVSSLKIARTQAAHPALRRSAPALGAAGVTVLLGTRGLPAACAAHWLTEPSEPPVALGGSSPA